MDPTGLLSSIYDAAINIDFGRKGLATRGKAEEGLVSYEDGVNRALSAFRDASDQNFGSAIDPKIIILAEYTFLTQELQLCEKTDNDTLNSLTAAVQSFDDAFLALKVVEDSTLYKAVDNCIPHNDKHRVKSFPKDAFHFACISHKTRLKNIIRSPGINPIEKDLLKQRLANLSTAQNGYTDMQRKVLDGK